MTSFGKLSIFAVALLFVGVQSYKNSWNKWKHCPWVNCKSTKEKVCQKITGDDGCWKCDCKPLCAPLKCDPGCEVQKEFEGPCPECECKKVPDEDDSWNKWKHCPWVNCKSTKEKVCQKITGDDGCWKCDCKPLCAPLKCDPGCEVQKEFEGPCPECECKPLCAPLKCDPGCEIQKEFEGPCPECECKKFPDEEEVSLQIQKKCAPVKCGAPCKEIPPESPEECPKCVCDDLEEVIEEDEDIICDTPKCPPGCSIEKEFEGPCPGCDCKDKNFEDIVKPKDIVCDPPKCPKGCSIEKEFDGPCPGCDCKDKDLEEEIKEIDIICDPPKCPPGCSIEKEFEGPCPGCDCKDEEEEPKVICDLPKCPEGCKVKVEYEGACPTCDCSGEGIMEPRQKCPPLECPRGCFPYSANDGSCSSCKCRAGIKEEKKCPEIKEDCHKPGCKLIMDEDGCDFCKCEPECAPPKCRRWCTVKEVEGECPVCDCPKRKIGWQKKRD